MEVGVEVGYLYGSSHGRTRVRARRGRAAAVAAEVARVRVLVHAGRLPNGRDKRMSVRLLDQVANDIPLARPADAAQQSATGPIRKLRVNDRVPSS